jgi:hypothetical protein
MRALVLLLALGCASENAPPPPKWWCEPVVSWDFYPTCHRDHAPCTAAASEQQVRSCVPAPLAFCMTTKSGKRGVSCYATSESCDEMAEIVGNEADPYACALTE